MYAQVPNILTVLRLLAAPMVGLVYVLLPSPNADWVALILFVSAAATDYLDGILARRWNVVSNLGRMLDPIADKAMVVIALAVIGVLWNGYIGVMIPTILILFREVFVSGLREFLGADAGRLQVTRLAKLKTTVQMFAITLLFVAQLANHYLYVYSIGMNIEIFQGIIAGDIEDSFGLRWITPLAEYSWNAALLTLWVATVLTVLTGIDYFLKALPYLRQDEK